MASKTITITLPEDLAEALDSKVRSGAFANESEVVSVSLREFVENENAAFERMDEDGFDDWLRRDAVPLAEAMQADPAIGLTLDQVRANLATEREQFRKAG